MWNKLKLVKIEQRSKKNVQIQAKRKKNSRGHQAGIKVGREQVEQL